MTSNLAVNIKNENATQQNYSQSEKCGFIYMLSWSLFYDLHDAFPDTKLFVL